MILVRIATMTIERAFGTTFGAAVLLEVVRVAFVRDSTIIAICTSVVGYLALVVLGFLLARAGHSYRTAFANMWPFVILWLVVGLVDITFDPRGWPPGLYTAENVSKARWGFVLATILYLPIAFAAAALGVFGARLARRIRARGAS